MPMWVEQNIIEALANMGERQEAKRESRDVLKLREGLYGSDHPYTVNTLHILATIFREEGNHTEAEGYIQRVLDRHLSYPGNNDKQTIMCLKNLAISLEHQNLYDKAAKYYRQAYKRIQKIP